jgi:hypothetical protein
MALVKWKDSLLVDIILARETLRDPSRVKPAGVGAYARSQLCNSYTVTC